MTFLAALLLVVAVLNLLCAVLNVRNARRNRAESARLARHGRRSYHEVVITANTDDFERKLKALSRDARRLGRRLS